MKILRLISRILIGALFVFSGFVKAIDPLGWKYKLIDYFDAFQLSSFTNLALTLTIILCSAEFVIGIMLLFGVKIRLASWGSLLFMAFFTPLTLYLALFNPVSDCGCFGDALVISNWQTFWKNIILLIPTLFTFIQRKKYKENHWITDWSVIAVFLFGIVYFSFYSINHLPPINFRPYHVGANIQEGMKIPDDAPRDSIVSSFIYEKNGEKKEFVYPNVPDSTWTWKETINKVIKKGYEPPIHDFSIETVDGTVITDEVLQDSGFVFLLVSYDLDNFDLKNIDKINDLALFCMSKNIRFICLSSASSGQINKFKQNTGANFEFCVADQTMLKTVIRSNPGLVLLQNGTITGEWHSNDIPDYKKFGDNISPFVLTQHKTAYETGLKYSMILGILLLLSVFLLIKQNLRK